MENQRKENRVYLISLILLALFAISFVSTMGFLNYRATAIELETSVIARVEKDNVAGIENALGFGKSFRNYYGIEDVFYSFKQQYPGPIPFVIDSEGNLLYVENGVDSENGQKILDYLESKEFEREVAELESKEGEVIDSGRWRSVFANVHQDGELVGYFGALYQDSIFDASFKSLKKSIFLPITLISIIECLLILQFVHQIKQDSWIAVYGKIDGGKLEKLLAIGVLSLGIIAVSFFSIYTFQDDYRNRIEESVKITLKNLESQIEHVKDQGVELREVEGLKEYIEERIYSIETLRAVRISEHISEVNRTDEKSNLITFTFGEKNTNDTPLYLEAEISDDMIEREINNIILVLLSAMIILLIFVFELNNLVDLSKAITSDRHEGLNEKQISLSLRFTGFLCSTAEYMCVPYAAMMIRDSKEALFGLSVGMTAALPLTVEGFVQMIGMLTLPKVVKKYDIKKVLLVSSIVMIICNLTSFAVGTALTIVICRALAGYAYAGFKQVSNYLITSGYETEKGRSENISQDNAGLLAGATCGAGLGAILSANAGYEMTFAISAFLFIFYLLGTMFLVPWKQLEMYAKIAEEEKPISAQGIVKMFTSAEMLFFILLVAIPLNIGVMLCVTLIPAICQTNGISSVMLSYCYIANGLAGIYIGPALVSRAKARFGLQPCIAFAFAITAASVFILHIPPIAVMIIVASMVLGFLDGFGTPMVTDRFMSLKVVMGEVDESTALIFYVVLSYVLLTFAPMIAELMLLPGKGFATPMMAGAAIYALAAVLLVVFRGKKKAE
jgi:predicted MFS family arabinose efflux permease